MIRRHPRVRAFLFVLLAGLFTAAPARAASIVVAPGGLFGYIPLDAFGITPTAVAADGVLDFDVPAFVFAGQTWNKVSMAENGYIVVGGGATDGAGPNQSLPDATSPNAILAPFWTDLTGGELRAGTLTDGVGTWLVLDWTGMTMAGGQTVDFQAWIGVGGSEDITFAYNNLHVPTSGLLTIGAQDPTGLVGMNYFYNGVGTLPTEDLRVTSAGLPVPEPATMSLLGAGLVLSAVARRRARRG